MRAKATRFGGFVFRSRTEAYAYEYLRLKYNPETLEYEPKHYSNENYVPDFILGSEKYHFAVEVKPILNKGNWSKYKQFMLDFTNIDSFYLLTPNEYEVLYRRWGRIVSGKTDRELWFQAINNVKHSLEQDERDRLGKIA